MILNKHNIGCIGCNFVVKSTNHDVTNIQVQNGKYNWSFFQGNLKVDENQAHQSKVCRKKNPTYIVDRHLVSASLVKQNSDIWNRIINLIHNLMT